MMRSFALLSQNLQKAKIPWSEQYRAKVILPSELEAKSHSLRKEGKSIATLNGSFDLLHAGHLHMIFEASKQGDVLIVALNSDSSIQKYKSPLRPIISLEYRLQMMAALEWVSFVTWFAETDPINILNMIKPNVHVNGAEYGENCIEANAVRAHGGTLHIVPLIKGLSTTDIIKKIRSLPPEGK
jgi:rfaE bifunctional protein nucleotidyltransferase chain/domain